MDLDQHIQEQQSLFQQGSQAWEQSSQPEKGLQHLSCSLDPAVPALLMLFTARLLCRCFPAWKGLSLKSTSWGFATSFLLCFISSKAEISCLDLA